MRRPLTAARAVLFTMLVFRPFLGEVLVGKVKSCDETGLYGMCSIGGHNLFVVFSARCASCLVGHSQCRWAFSRMFLFRPHSCLSQLLCKWRRYGPMKRGDWWLTVDLCASNKDEGLWTWHYPQEDDGKLGWPVRLPAASNCAHGRMLPQMARQVPPSL